MASRQSMPSGEDNERDQNTDPPGSIASPFLEGELFLGESTPDWEVRLSALEAESPFLSGNPRDKTTSFEQEEWEALPEDGEAWEEPEAYEQPQEQATAWELPKVWEESEERTEQLVFEEEAPPLPPILQPMTLSTACIKQLKNAKVAVVGGGMGGLMAALRLQQHGIQVTVYEARPWVGGRVLSNHTFSSGRIVEEGAELIGSFHTLWLTLALKYGVAVVSRMETDQYEREGLAVRLWLDKDLSMKEVIALFGAMEKVEAEIVKTVSEIDKVTLWDADRPWDSPTLKTFDQMSVADALEKIYKVKPGSRLWMGMEYLLVNDEVAQLKDMNFLGLLCKVKGGQGERLLVVDNDKPNPMGYWHELEIFRCADGCQKLAEEMAREIKEAKNKVVLSQAVTHIGITDKGVTVISRRVLDHVRRTLDDGTPLILPYDYVVLASPPSVWDEVKISDKGKELNLKVEVGALGMGDALKLFSDVKERFWIKNKMAPLGGSAKIGQVWEGTDNQTRTGSQGIVLSVFVGPILSGPKGPRPPTSDEIQSGLRQLYPDDRGPGYARSLKKTLFSNWPAVPFIKTGYASPRLGQIFTIGKKLNEPFHGRLFFAGEHTQMAFFGYMEGALRSGKNAADLLIAQSCGIKPASKPQTTIARAEIAEEETALAPEFLEEIFDYYPSSDDEANYDKGVNERLEGPVSSGEAWANWESSPEEGYEEDEGRDVEGFR